MTTQQAATRIDYIIGHFVEALRFLSFGESRRADREASVALAKDRLQFC